MSDIQQQIERQIEELKKSTFFDPTYDAVFKEIFSKDSTLVHFLNAILHLENEHRIHSIERRKPSVKLSSKIGREEVRFDIHAKLESCEYIDLEVQRASHDDFLDRIELYTSQLAINSKIDFDKHRTAEENEVHPYKMPRTYSVWICNFDVPFCKSHREELALFRFSDVGSKNALPIYDKKRYICVDLTKYMPTEGNTAEALWLNLFTQMASASEVPKTHDKVIADVYARMTVGGASEKWITEVATGMVTQAEISTRIGMARREGREEGREEGLNEARQTLVLNSLRKGKTPDEVADFLDLPLETILEIQKQM